MQRMEVIVDSRRRNGCLSLKQGERARTAGMPELRNDTATRLMHIRYNLAPSGGLFIAIQTWRALKRLRTARDVDRFGNDKTGTGTLNVIARHKVRRDVVFVSTS